MKNLILLYLLAKSALRRKLTWLDIELAQSIRRYNNRLYGNLFSLIRTPTWIEMIAEMEQEATLPEAFQDFVIGCEEALSETFAGWAKKLEEWME